MENDIHNQVRLVPWQEEWEKEYHLEKQCIVGILLDLCDTVDIYHVGSTSVKGMISKPIIDILVCLNEKIPLEEAAEKLEQFQYRNLGECGRPGRYFLSSGDEPGKMFYLHLCHKNHPVAQDQLLFQALERNNSAIFSNYYMLKTELAALFPDNRMMYRKIKGMYIESVLSAYRMAKAPGIERTASLE